MNWHPAKEFCLNSDEEHATPKHEQKLLPTSVVLRCVKYLAKAA